MTEAILTAIVIEELSEYFDKYDVTFTFGPMIGWRVIISKDGIDLHESDGYDEPIQVFVAARNYLDRINNKQREYNPNF